MVYKTEREKIGVTIKISSYRKHGNGAIGGGRKNTSGKKAIISKDGTESIILTAGTLCQLLKDVRSTCKISPDVRINQKGETYI